MTWRVALQMLLEQYETSEVAERLEVSPVTIWRWQNGKRTPRKPYQRALLAWAKKATADD